MASTIDHGKRAISVPTADSTAARGLIQPRSHVDVIFTRTGSMREAVTATILQDVIVLSIGRQTEITGSGDPTKVNTQPINRQNLSATLMVNPEEAKKLELAKNQGKISLALRNPMEKVTAARKHAGVRAA